MMFRTALTCLTFTLIVPAASASFIDEFSDTSNFSPRNSGVTITANNGTVELIRNSAGFTNIDYYPGAEANGAVGFNNNSDTFSLSDQNIFTVSDIQPIDPGQEENIVLAFRVFFHDASDNFIGGSELVLQNDTFFATGSTFQANLADVATTNGIVGAEAYNILISINAQGDAGDGYSFGSITAVPEPASAALVLAGLALVAPRRRNRA